MQSHTLPETINLVQPGLCYSNVEEIHFYFATQSSRNLLPLLKVSRSK